MVEDTGTDGVTGQVTIGGETNQQYEDIFSLQPEVQLQATRLLQSALETREKLLNPL